MIYSPSTTAALGIVEDAQPEEPLTLRGEGLWVCLISSGKCVVSLSDLELMPAGSALLLPPVWITELSSLQPHWLHLLVHSQWRCLPTIRLP